MADNQNNQLENKVIFYNRFKEVLKESNEKEGYCEDYTLNRDIILYADIQCGEFTLTFELKDNRLNFYFPYQYDDGKSLVNYKRTLKEGKYRLILPSTLNEDIIKINYIANTDKFNAKFYIVPNYADSY